MSSLFCSVIWKVSSFHGALALSQDTGREEHFCGQAPALSISHGTRDNQGGLPYGKQIHGRLLLPLRLTPQVVSFSKSMGLGLCLFSVDLFLFCKYFCSPLVIAQAEFAVGRRALLSITITSANKYPAVQCCFSPREAGGRAKSSSGSMDPCVDSVREHS